MKNKDAFSFKNKILFTMSEKNDIGTTSLETGTEFNKNTICIIKLAFAYVHNKSSRSNAQWLISNPKLKMNHTNWTISSKNFILGLIIIIIYLYECLLAFY